MTVTPTFRPKPVIRLGQRQVQRVFCLDHNRDEASVQWVGTGSEYPFCDVRPVGEFTGVYSDGSPMDAADVRRRLEQLAGVQITTDGEVV